MILDMLSGFSIGVGVTAIAFGWDYRKTNIEIHDLAADMERLCKEAQEIIDRDAARAPETTGETA